MKLYALMPRDDESTAVVQVSRVDQLLNLEQEVQTIASEVQEISNELKHARENRISYY